MFVCVLQVAPLLGHFATPWCNSLRNIRDDLEKEQAFRGLLSVVQRAPEPAVEAFTALAGECCCSDAYTLLHAELLVLLLLQGYRSMGTRNGLES